MEFGWKKHGSGLGIENEGGDGATIPELVDDRMFHPKSNSKITTEVTQYTFDQ